MFINWHLKIGAHWYKIFDDAIMIQNWICIRYMKDESPSISIIQLMIWNIAVYRVRETTDCLHLTRRWGARRTTWSGSSARWRGRARGPRPATRAAPPTASATGRSRSTSGKTTWNEYTEKIVCMFVSNFLCNKWNVNRQVLPEWFRKFHLISISKVIDSVTPLKKSTFHGLAL